MISRDTVEEFTKAFVDGFNTRSPGQTTPWSGKSDKQRDVWRAASRDGFRSIGVKVEGDEESSNTTTGEVRF